MNTMKTCSDCQKALEADAPDGPCLECLLKAGLGTGVDMGPDRPAESGRTSLGPPPWQKWPAFLRNWKSWALLVRAAWVRRQKSLDVVVALRILSPGIRKDPVFAEKEIRNPSRSNVEGTLRQLLP